MMLFIALPIWQRWVGVKGLILTVSKYAIERSHRVVDAIGI